MSALKARVVRGFDLGFFFEAKREKGCSLTVSGLERLTIFLE